MLQQLSHKNWVSWLDTSIPALHHVIPREAAKTALGRELLVPRLLNTFFNECRPGI